MGPFAPAFFPSAQNTTKTAGDAASSASNEKAASASNNGTSDLRHIVHELKEQVAALERRLEEESR
jgi:uncharacterized protein YceH (UPF0502 family)